MKAGSDVAHILFHILPQLNPGVIVHFHDIYWPFEYPKSVLLSGRVWNEAYCLRAFLQYNHSFEMLYFASFMAKFHRDVLEDLMPLILRNPGGSLWIQKRSDPHGRVGSGSQGMGT